VTNTLDSYYNLSGVTSYKWRLQSKVDVECRSFQEKWTNNYFYVEVKSKPVCLVYGDALAVLKKPIWSVITAQNMLNSMK
jgi:hypothetical protein